MASEVITTLTNISQRVFEYWHTMISNFCRWLQEGVPYLIVLKQKLQRLTEDMEKVYRLAQQIISYCLFSNPMQCLH